MTSSTLIARFAALDSIDNAAELRNLAQENDPELQAEGLLRFAGREERAGHREVAASIYQEMLAGRETGTDGTVLASAYQRAQSRLNALTGENAELGARVEVLLGDFTRQATEPSMLLAMGAAGAAFRATRFLALSRLAANPSANMVTRGLGARGLAGLAGFAVEAPTFTLAGRLGSEALGRSQDWSGRAVGQDLASSFLVLGALKAGGLASAGLLRRVGPAAHPLQGLVQQGGMLAGILGAHRLEEISGLRETRPGSSSLVESLAMLLQFNVAGRLTRGVFGEGFRRWENSLDLRTEGLAQANRGPSQGSFPTLTLPGLQPALALSGVDLARPRPESQETRPELSQQVFMIGRGREKGSSSKIDDTGIRAIRGLRDLKVPESGDMWPIIRQWIEQQPHPIIVGEIVMSSDLAIVQVINKPFTEQLRWSEASLRNQSVRRTFHSMSDSFVGSRVPLLALRLFTSDFVEYDPTRMRLTLPDGSPVSVVGAGAIRTLQGKKIAFGIFTEIGPIEVREGSTPVPASAVRSIPPPEAPEDSNALAKNHFRNAQKALNSDSKDD